MTTYSNPRLAADIENWPHGAHRTTARFTIDADPKRGERATRTTLNPKTGRVDKPKVTTFAHKARIVDGDDGRTYIAKLSGYGHISIMRGDMKFQHEIIHERDSGYAAALELFA